MLLNVCVVTWYNLPGLEALMLEQLRSVCVCVCAWLAYLQLCVCSPTHLLGLTQASHHVLRQRLNRHRLKQNKTKGVGMVTAEVGSSVTSQLTWS